MLGALLMLAALGPPPPYPSPADRQEIRRLMRDADLDYFGVEPAPPGTAEALARHVERLVAAARPGAEREAQIRRDVAAALGPAPSPRPGIPRPLDNRLSKLSVHARALLRILDRPEAPEAR